MLFSAYIYYLLLAILPLLLALFSPSSLCSSICPMSCPFHLCHPFNPRVHALMSSTAFSSIALRALNHFIAGLQCCLGLPPANMVSRSALCLFFLLGAAAQAPEKGYSREELQPLTQFRREHPQLELTSCKRNGCLMC